MTGGIQGGAPGRLAARADWEAALTAYFLRIPESGEAAPIRSFEVTAETLAQVAGLPPDKAAEAERAFHSAVRSDEHVIRSLVEGCQWASTKELSQCMVPLALSLLVDSLMDEEYSSIGQYRERLRQWLGKSFSVLRGIAEMWRDLKAWLDEQVAAGRPFRRLVLPNPPSTWKHIGYTKYLSFPTRRDVRLLERLLDRYQNLDDRHALVLALEAGMAQQRGLSPGLESAFAEFRAAFREGRATAEHRFWKLLQRARSNIGRSERPAADLRIDYDEDGRRCFFVAAGGQDQPEPFADLGQAVRSPKVAASPNLGAAVRRGALFFAEAGIASWAASADPPPRGARAYVGLSSVHRQSMPSPEGFEPSGDWLLSTAPIGAAQARGILSLACPLALQPGGLASISLAGGVKTDACWLGRPAYLPSVEGIRGRVAVRRVDGDGPCGLTLRDGRLSSAGPVSGEFILESQDAEWSRSIRFAADALPHPCLEGRAYGLPPLPEWEKLADARPKTAFAGALHWADEEFPGQAMLEALYAAGRSGLDERQAVELVGRAAHRRQIWDVLRCLVEAAFLDVRLREGWRGRVYTLRRPALQAVEALAGTAVVAEGALASWAERDFKAAVEANGGSAFRRPGAGPFSPPIIGACGIDPAVLSDRLGWPLRAHAARPLPAGPGALASAPASIQNHEPAAAWSWEARAFSPDPGPCGAGDVRLTRWVHPGGRDHDLYRVEGRGRASLHLSRNAAILQAHRIAGRALLRYEDGMIHRIGSEGALPLEVAAALRLRSLANPGPTDGGYAYPAGAGDARWVASLLPTELEGAAGPGAGGQGLAGLGCRRGRLARRPLWSNGSLVQEEETAA